MPVSLHDLIYNKGDDAAKEEEVQPPSNSTARASRKRSRSAATESRRTNKAISAVDSVADTTTAKETKHDDVFTTAAQRLDVLYNSAAITADGPNNAMILLRDALQPPPPVVGLVRAAATGRRRSSSSSRSTKKIHYAKPGRPHYKNTHLTVLASAAQVRERQGKQARQMEWTRIREKWKKRKYDLRSEVDVGNAVRQSVERVVNESSSNSNKRKRTASFKGEEEEEASLPPPQEEIVDTSEEEQENILAQLMRGSQEAKARASKESDDVHPKEDVRPYAERLDYWERGLTQPEPKDIRDYRRQVSAAVHPGLNAISGNGPKDTSGDKDCISLKHLKLPFRRSVNEPSTFFPLDHNQYCHPSFAQHRQILRLAARTIASLPSKGSEEEDRLIRAIWHRDVHDARYSTSLRFTLTQRGCNLELFLTHKWKDREAATERLAVAQNLQLAGPPDWHGYTMSAKDRGGESGRKDRKAVVRALSCGKVEWSPSAKKKRYTDFSPTVTYVPVPGTAPPRPWLPLDETGILFGPEDEFSNYLSNAPIDEQTFKLTLASLFGRFAIHHSRGSSSSCQAFVKQLRSMCERSIELNRNDGVQVLSIQGVPDIPLPQLYMVCMGYLSLAVNGLVQKDRPRPSIDELELDGSLTKHEQDYYHENVHKEHEEEQHSDKVSEVGWSTVAARMFDSLHKDVQSKGLERFGRLHLTMVLLRIGKDLPNSAAEIWSRPLDERDSRTPFDLVRLMLEHMEEEGQLADDKVMLVSPSNIVRVGELEFSFHQGAKIVGRCIERDATDLRYHCWHLAILAGCLLLCSGNRMGSGAYLHPSGVGNNDDQRMYDSFHDDSQPLASHEIRRMLPKFHELRRETAKALQLLFQLAKYQRGSRAHLAIASFLEWSQVVALFLGPAGSNETVFSAVRLVHEYHATRWALNDLTSRHYLLQRESSFTVLTPTRLEALARELERNPHEKANWRALVEALGPVGTHTVSSGKRCAKNLCKACWMLCPGLFIDHKREKERRATDAGWWGRTRQSWWCRSLLDMDNVGHTTLPYRAKKLYESLDAELSRLAVLGRQSMVERHLTSEEVDGLWNEILEGPLAGDTSKGASMLVSESARSQTVEKSLPQKFCDVIDQPVRVPSPVLAVPPFSRDPAIKHRESEDDLDRLEVGCYQVVIASHLYSPGREWVRWKVLDLAIRCWKGFSSKAGLRSESAEMDALKWLYQMGISGVHAVRISIKENGRYYSNKEEPRKVKL